MQSLRMKMLVLLGALLFSSGGSSIALPAAELAVETAPDVDERLYLLRVLETLHGNWGLSMSDEESVAALRTQAVKLRRRIKDGELDDELGVLYDDFIGTIDVFDQFKRSLDRIEKASQIEGNKEAFGVGMRAGVTGAATYDALRNQRTSTGQAAGTTLAVASVQMLFDAWQASQRLEAAKVEAVAAERTKLVDRIMAMSDGAKNAAFRMAKQHEWPAGEVGWDVSPEQGQRIIQLLESDDLRNLLPIVRALEAKRRRDPFTRVFANELACCDHQADGKTVLLYARDTIQAARYIPSDPAYDDYRHECFFSGATLAYEARIREIDAGIDPLGSTEASKFAVRVWDELLDRRPNDATGSIRFFLAAALLVNNQPREADQVFAKIVTSMQSEPEFWYLKAAIAARSNDFPTALIALRRCGNTGPFELEHAAVDPNFTALRQARHQEFLDATETRYAWNVVFGIFNDDVTVTNKSTFPISNVVFRPVLEQDARVWAPTLEAERISPGETFTWSNVVSIPDSRISKRTAKLFCDQAPERAP